MKNTNKLFGRRLTKLFLTPVLSIGLVAGFAVTPASADFAPYQPYAGEITVVKTGNAVDGFTLDWSTWIPAARMFDDPASREALFDSTGIPFAIVACTNESVVITDCIEGSYNNELEPLTNSTFVGIMRDTNISTGTVASGAAPNVLRSVNVTRSGSATPPLQWDENPNAVGYFTDRQGNPTDRQGNQTPNSTTPSLFTNSLTAAAYKFYVYIAIPNQLFNPTFVYPPPARGSNYEHPYYASAPISVDFRTLSATPTISAQPVSASKTVGDSLSLSVTATRTGSGTLSYQWKKGGTAISGATSATLSIPSVAASDAGSYTVDVTNTDPANPQNLNGFAPVTVSSSAAVVKVAAAPTPTATATPTPTPTATATPTPTPTPTPIPTPTSTVAPKAAIEFKIPEGKPVAAAPVDVEVEGLKDQSKYVITVRSTPIIVDQGTIFNSRLKTSIKIPAGLTPGWHSITIDATAADGSPWNEVMYFEVSASGLLKSTSTIRTANPGAIAFSAGTGVVSSATKKNLKATVKEAGKSAKYTITGSAGQLPGVSDKAVKALAKKRANVLKAYLVKLGVSKSSITIKTKVVKQGKKPKASVLALY